MKKRLLLGIASLAVLATGLASCQNPTSSTSSASSTTGSSVQDTTGSSVQDTTTSNVTDSGISVSVNRTSVTVEEGVTTNIIATVVSPNGGDLTATFTSADETIATVKRLSNGVGAAITGVKVGTTTITVASTQDPTKTATVAVTVTSGVATLQDAWTALSALDNYTIEVSQTGELTTGEVATILDHKIYRTENAISYVIPAENTTTNKDEPSWLAGQDSKTISRYGYAVVGEGADATVINLDVDMDPNTFAKEWVVPAEKALGSNGFLTPENFDGTGAATPNDLPSLPIYGLGAISKAWLPTEKEVSNVYEINGDTQEHNADYAFAETVLWQMMDYSGYVKYMQTLSGAGVDLYFYNIAKGIDTEITVRGETDITISLTDNTTGIVTTATITNIGTTTQDSITGTIDGTETNLDSFVAGLTDEDITMPATPGNLEYVRDALQENRNYITHDEWSAPTIENGAIVPNEYTNYDRKAYYTDKYVFFDTPGDAYYDAMEIYYGEEISEEERAPFGYVEKDGSVYHFNVVGGEVVIDETEPIFSGSIVDSPLFLGNAAIFSDPEDTTLFNFAAYESTIWVGDTRTYAMAQDAASYQALYEAIYLDEAPTYGAAFISGIGVSFVSDQSTEVKEIRFTLGYSEDAYSYMVSNYSIDSFGEGASNSMDAAIQAAIAA